LVLNLLHHFFVVWEIQMAEDDIARVLQNAEFEEILPESRNVDGINVDKQQEYNIYCTSQKAYGRHHDLVDRYGISVSQMTTDMFHWL
jgi:hypothetical protein